VISQSESVFFSRVFGISSYQIGSRAVATGSDGTACILALGPTANKAISGTGSFTISLQSCDMGDNSSSPDAVDLIGSYPVTANDQHRRRRSVNGFRHDNDHSVERL
jgi:hypothetical protein